LLQKKKKKGIGAGNEKLKEAFQWSQKKSGVTSKVKGRGSLRGGETCGGSKGFSWEGVRGSCGGSQLQKKNKKGCWVGSYTESGKERPKMGGTGANLKEKGWS